MLLLRRLPKLIYILIVASIAAGFILVINHNKNGLINGLPSLSVIVSIFAVGFVSHYFEKALRSKILEIRNALLLPALKERIADLTYTPDDHVSVAVQRKYTPYPFCMNLRSDLLRGVHNGQTYFMSNLTLCRMEGESLEDVMDGYAMSMKTTLAPESNVLCQITGKSSLHDITVPSMPREWLARIIEAVRPPLPHPLHTGRLADADRQYQGLPTEGRPGMHQHTDHQAERPPERRAHPEHRFSHAEPSRPVILRKQTFD